MKNTTKFLFGAMLTWLPMLAMAETASSSIPAPVHLSPSNGVALTTSNFTSVDWADVVVGSTSLSYYYEASKGLSAASDGSFSTPLYVSPLLATSSISVSSTTEGLYYWHVRAIDTVGSTSPWSVPSSVVIDNTAPSIPGAPILTTSVSPTASTTNGTQTWVYASSTDTLSGISKYEYTVNGTTTWIDNGLNTSFTTTFGIGTYTIFVHAIDRAGNVSTSSSASVTVTASSTVATSTPPGVTPNPTDTKQCKKYGWKKFTNPTFKNQGRCVSFVEKMLRDKKKEEARLRREARKQEREAHDAAEKREHEIKEIGKKWKIEREENDHHSSQPQALQAPTIENEHSNNGNSHGKGREGN